MCVWARLGGGFFRQLTSLSSTLGSIYMHLPTRKKVLVLDETTYIHECELVILLEYLVA